ncbi:MAG TPA: polymer-forming cytoskeletal protein [Myxococcota bacterium]|nr:polymer-forming cytoskeletal protein [Myxococcota bacterium]
MQREAMANIGKSITIKGDLTGEEDIQVEGTVEGRVDLPNNQFTVGAEGRVRAEIHAKSVVVIGQVHGNIIAAERLEVQATGVIHGDVKAPRLIVHEGAVLNGSIEMSKSPAPAKVSLAAASGA